LRQKRETTTCSLFIRCERLRITFMFRPPWFREYTIGSALKDYSGRFGAQKPYASRQRPLEVENVDVSGLQ